MSLAHEIQKFQQEMAGKIPEEIKDLFARKTLELVQTGIAQKTLQVGDSAPSFSLPDVFGKQVTSAELLQSGPVVISFYRGAW